MKLVVVLFLICFSGASFGAQLSATNSRPHPQHFPISPNNTFRDSGRPYSYQPYRQGWIPISNSSLSPRCQPVFGVRDCRIAFKRTIYPRVYYRSDSQLRRNQIQQQQNRQRRGN